MSKSEENAYILGTDAEELFRLGLQAQLWASDAHIGWRTAGFTAGQTILDLGCGPGFATQDLAYLTGPSGKVIAVDKSPYYIDHLTRVATLHGLNIEAICTDFDQLELEENSIDRMYCRWALAWIDNPTEILSKVFNALKPGGSMVIHEYYDWTTHQTEPKLPNLNKAISAAYKSFTDSPGDIDVGRKLPGILASLGMHLYGTRPMSKVANHADDFWNWPKSFYHSYFPRLIELGLLTTTDVELALEDLNQLEHIKGSSICCPLMYEVIAEKHS